MAATLDVGFQHVVHPALIGEAEVVEALANSGGRDERAQECPSYAAGSRTDCSGIPRRADAEDYRASTNRQLMAYWRR